MSHFQEGQRLRCLSVLCIIMNDSTLIQKWILPHALVIWAGFLVVCAIFGGYVVLLRKQALTVQHSEMQYLQAEQAELQARNRELEDTLTALRQKCPEAQSSVTEPNNGGAHSHPGNSRSFQYTVQKGDTIWDIASMYNVDVKALMRWNNLNPRSQIFPGDTITIILEQ